MSLACHSWAWQKACQHFDLFSTRCVTMRRRQRAAGNYSWLAKGVEIGSDSSDWSFNHSKGKNGQNLQVTFFTFTLITFGTLPIFSNQTHFQKVDVQHVKCTNLTVSPQNFIMEKKLENVWGPEISECTIVLQVWICLHFFSLGVHTRKRWTECPNNKSEMCIMWRQMLGWHFQRRTVSKSTVFFLFHDLAFISAHWPGNSGDNFSWVRKFLKVFCPEDGATE